MPTPLRCAWWFPACLLLSALPLLVSAAEDNWPRFRGPNGSGLGQGDIPAQWTDANKKWNLKLPGNGHGSPVVWGGRIFLLCGDPATGARIPLCVSAKDGTIEWQPRFDSSVYKMHKFNSLASSTPAVDADRVYFAWGTPQKITVIAFQHDGTKAWEADLGPVKREHGFACSPVIHDGLVFLSNDQEKDCALFALDAKTGAVRWKLPREENHSNYATPCVYTPPGGPTQVVISSWRTGFTGVEAATGKALWTRDVFGKQTAERAIGSPFTAGEYVIADCGFVGGQKHTVALKPGKEPHTMDEAWRFEKSSPHIPTPIVVGDRAYLWNDQGVITCVKLASGETVWQERVKGEFFSSPVAAGGKIFCADKQGNVVVIAAADQFQLLATNAGAELCQSTPAIAGGRLYLRTWEHLLAVGK